MSREVLRRLCRVARRMSSSPLNRKILNIQGIMHAKVIDLPRVLLYSTANAATPGRKLTPYDFREDEFLAVAGEDNDFVTDLIRSVCKPYGFTPKIQPVHSTDAMIMGVQCGLGVAVTDSMEPGTGYSGIRVSGAGIHASAQRGVEKRGKRSGN